MMLRVDTSNFINTAINNAQAAKSCEKSVSNANDVNLDINRIATPDSIKNDIDIKDNKESNIVKIEDKITAMQKANETVLGCKELVEEVKTKFEDTVKMGQFNEKKDEMYAELAKLVEKINENADRTTFQGKKVLDGTIKEIPKFDSDELGITADTKYILDNVRVGGESYVPNYSFDISTVGGSGAALSVLESAISKIQSITQKITNNINELMQYPEILELDRLEVSGAQSQVRSVNTARLLVNKLKNNIRYKINEVQSAQKVQRNNEVINLLTDR